MHRSPFHGVSCMVYHVQVSVLSSVVDHKVDEGSETAARAMEQAADEEVVRGRDEGGSTDHEEVLSVEAEWADGGGGSTGSQAQGEATARGQSGYLPEGRHGGQGCGPDSEKPV